MATGKSHKRPRTDARIPRTFERLALTLNPEFVSASIARGTYGYTRTFEQRNATNRFYEINLDHFKNVIQTLTSQYVTVMMMEKNIWSPANVEVEANYIAPLVRDACVTALYARLRPVHRALADYSQRFDIASVYPKDMELPLPFADAIQNFGPFNPASIPRNYLCVPVYPENTLNEGRTAAQWSSLEYEATIPRMKEIGIPFKSVDTSVKPGSAWWCMHYERHGNSRDIVCLYPPINYSDHSVLLAALFIRNNPDGNDALQLVTAHSDDQEWPARLIDIPLSYPLQIFAALCQ